ncbi:H/ACA ribonucleoprotein complex subunit 2-like protein [Saccostrea echinata]|uniref:H/ACA ribonucleoprotein complex subunit 2-like protein n=1 Tax=Saccostrea echinata TaxID=191078 RepID=UPI002A7FC2FD|nr:H/ACA ribonucleoprotein complex subunit 2-like protein [Saccostrea echinata]
MGKEKKEKRKSEGGEEVEEKDGKEAWLEKTKYLSPISKPLAPRKLTKRLYKVIRKAQSKKNIVSGIKFVQKSIRKGDHNGIMILAGDVSPIDVISHIPILCEENQIPYCYVPSKTDLGAACGNRRSMSLLIVKPNEDYKELFEECKNEVENLPMPV